MSFETKNYDPAQMLGASDSVQTVANIFAGAGAPTFSAPKGSFYLNTTGSSTSTRAYINTDGATTWTNVVTAA